MTRKTDIRPRPYICVLSFCGGKFIKKGGLSRHMKKHSEGKRIKCCFTGCKHSTERKDNLYVHIKRKHMGVNKYSEGKRIKCCFIGCKHSSKRKYNLDAHIRRKHMGWHSNIIYKSKMYTSRVRGEVDGESSKGMGVNGVLDTTPEIIPRDTLDILGEREVIRQLEVVIEHLTAENESLTRVLHPFLMKKYGEVTESVVTGVLDSEPGIISREMLEIFRESEEIQKLGVAIKYLETKSECLSTVLCPFLLEKYASTDYD